MLTGTVKLVDEATVVEILKPLRERYARDFGLVWGWKYQIGIDEWGNPQIWVYVYKDSTATVEQMHHVRDERWAPLEGDPATGDYAPIVLFYNIPLEWKDYSDDDD